LKFLPVYISSLGRDSNSCREGATSHIILVWPYQSPILVKTEWVHMMITTCLRGG